MINQELDEFLYPHAKILTKFNIPKKYFQYGIIDHRESLWKISTGCGKLILGTELTNDNNPTLIGRTEFYILDPTESKTCEDLIAILSQSSMVPPFNIRKFVIVNKFNEVIHDSNGILVMKYGEVR